MSRYRLIEVKTPQKTRNKEAIVDFVPEIYLEITYKIQVKYSIFSSWETIVQTNNLESAEVLFELEQMQTQIKKIL
jgi:thiamine pyrophosphokinase